MCVYTPRSIYGCFVLKIVNSFLARCSLLEFDINRWIIYFQTHIMYVLKHTQCLSYLNEFEYLYYRHCNCKQAWVTIDDWKLQWKLMSDRYEYWEIVLFPLRIYNIFVKLHFTQSVGSQNKAQICRSYLYTVVMSMTGYIYIYISYMHQDWKFWITLGYPGQVNRGSSAISSVRS